MALQGVLAKGSDGMFVADRVRARKALVAWLGGLAEGNVSIKLNDVARAENLSPKKLRTILRQDEDLQKEVFGGLNDEAKLLLVKALAHGHELVDQVAPDPKEVRLWAEFAARYAGGGYEKREGQVTGIMQFIANISLPAGFKQAEARVIEPDAVDAEFEGLLPDDE